VGGYFFYGFDVGGYFFYGFDVGGYIEISYPSHFLLPMVSARPDPTAIPKALPVPPRIARRFTVTGLDD
jgi:hypothetical protein